MDPQDASAAFFSFESIGTIPDRSLETLQTLSHSLPPPKSCPGDIVKFLECVLCCTRATNSTTGVYVDPSTYTVLCRDHLHYLNGCDPVGSRRLLLSVRIVEIELTNGVTNGSDVAPMPTKLAIGVSGGFESGANTPTVRKELIMSICCLSCDGDYQVEEIVNLPKISDLDTFLSHMSNGLTAYESMLYKSTIDNNISNWVVTFLRALGRAVANHSNNPWEDESAEESRFSNDLVQVANPPVVDIVSAQCQRCGSTANLWLNLSDGYIGCGRKHHEGMGGCADGSQGAAVLHNAANPTYHLAVKLGTISQDGEPDVYSYTEGKMVTNRFLRKQLEHFGIDVEKSKKTDKTIRELEIELNQKYNWSKITEDGADLKPLKGPGFTGLKNLGNTCYMSACLQLLRAVPEIQVLYGSSTITDRQVSRLMKESSNLQNLAGNLYVQYAKLTHAMSTGKAGDGQDCAVISPDMFRLAAVKNNSQFSTHRQQDADEFFRYFIDQLAISERQLISDFEMANLFEAEVVKILKCKQSNQIRYRYETHLGIALGTPPEVQTALMATTATNPNEESKNIGATPGGADIPPVSVPFEECLSSWAGEEVISDFLSPATNEIGEATQETRFVSFPPYLVVHMKRFYLDSHWMPQKIQNPIPVPSTLDLENLRFAGEDQNAARLPEGSAPRVKLDENIIANIVSMGFSENAAKRACIACNNSSIESCTEWVIARCGDPSADEPLQESEMQTGTSVSGTTPEPKISMTSEAAVLLMSMGFSESNVEAALKATGGDQALAAEWLLQGGTDAVLEGSTGSTPVCQPSPVLDALQLSLPPRTGCGKYQLMGFLSHVGQSVTCGHYVAHLKLDDAHGGKWALYNDEHVAESAGPPTAFGYLYLYRRLDAV